MNREKEINKLTDREIQKEINEIFNNKYIGNNKLTYMFINKIYNEIIKKNKDFKASNLLKPQSTINELVELLSSENIEFDFSVKILT